MRGALAFVLIVHGLIHLMGLAKAFGWAELAALTQPISRPMGVLWLVAALLFVATTIALFALPRWWWAIGAVAIAVSQVVIVSSWADAKAGTIANLVVLLAVGIGALAEGPTSLPARFDAEVARGLARSASSPTIREEDLAPLPAPVQRYLRAVGVVGQPRPRGLRARFVGRIRSGPSAAWMTFEARQVSFLDTLTRLFFMRASMSGLPVQVFHAFVGPRATMDVRVLGAVPMVHAEGAEMNRSETVTLLNDMAVLAPASLLSPSIAWSALDDHRARASLTHEGITVAADLVFGDDDTLVDFVSDDRLQSQDDGSFRLLRWSTPLRAPRAFGPLRLPSRAETRWHPPEGEWVYGEFELTELETIP